MQTLTSVNSGGTESKNQVMLLDFHGDQIVTFEVDGEPYVAMRPIVENMALSWGSQRDKLRGQAAKFNCTDISAVGADGKVRKMLAIPVAKLALWLSIINPNKIKDPDKRGKIELYQAESAIVLHDYWTKGVAIRGDLDGVVTDLDPKVMQAIGGMMKGIIGKALNELVPAMVEAQLADQELGIVRGVTSLDVAIMAGVKDRRGLRGLGNFISSRLKHYHAEKGIPVKVRDYGPMATVYSYDKATSKEWLACGGKAAIEAYVRERRGQGSLLKLVPNETPERCGHVDHTLGQSA